MKATFRILQAAAQGRPPAPVTAHGVPQAALRDRLSDLRDAIDAKNGVHVSNVLASMMKRDEVPPLAMCHTVIRQVGRFRDRLPLCTWLMEMLRQRTQGPLPVAVYNAMIQVLGDFRYMKACKRYYREMEASGVKPNSYTFSAMLNAHAKRRQSGDCLALLRQMPSHGVPPNVYHYNQAIDCAAKAGVLEVCVKLVQDMKEAGLQPTAFTYATLLEILGKEWMIEECELLFQQMKAAGVTLSGVVYLMMIRAYKEVGMADKCQALFTEMIERGIEPDYRVCGALLAAFSGGKAMELFQHIVERGFSPRVYSLLRPCGQVGDVGQCLELLKIYGMRPDGGIFYTLIDTLGKIGGVKQCLQMIGEMAKLNLLPDRRMLGVLLRACAVVGDTDIATYLGNRMHLLGGAFVEHYDELIALCEKAGLWTDALQWSQEMARRRLVPSIHSISSVLSCFLSTGGVEPALQYLNSMKSQHYEGRMHSLWIAPFARAGELQLCLQWLRDIRDQKADWFTEWDRRYLERVMEKCRHIGDVSEHEKVLAEIQASML